MSQATPCLSAHSPLQILLLCIRDAASPSRLLLSSELAATPSPPLVAPRGRQAVGQQGWLGTVSPGQILPHLTYQAILCPVCLQMVPQQEKPLVKMFLRVPLIHREPEAPGHAAGVLSTAVAADSQHPAPVPKGCCCYSVPGFRGESKLFSFLLSVPL